MISIGESLPEERKLDQTACPEISFVPARHSTSGEVNVIDVIAKPSIDALLVQNPATFMFVYGSINYRDIFRRERRTGFALWLDRGSPVGFALTPGNAVGITMGAPCLAPSPD